jgi:hypothetical protein
MAILDIFNRNKTSQTSSLQNFSANLFGTKAPTLPKMDTSLVSRPTSPLPAPRLSTPVVATSTATAPRAVTVDRTPTTVSQLTAPSGFIPPAPTGTNAVNKLDMQASASLVPNRVSDRSSGLTRMTDLLEQQGKQSERYNELADEQGFAKKQEAYNEALAQEAIIDRQYERQLRTLREGAVGQSEGSIQNQEQELRRMRSQEVADLAIITAARQGDVTTAQNIIKQKLDAEFEPIAQQIETLQSFLQLNQDDLSESEKIMLQAQIDQQTASAKSQYDQAVTSNQANAYQTMLDNGTITIDKVPKEVLGYLNTQGYVPAEQKAALQLNKANLDNAFKILNNSALTGATGKLRVPGFLDFSGSYKNVREDIVSLMAGMTLDNLAKMKGVPSDRDILIVQSATSKLGNPENLKELGDKQIVDELQKVTGVFADAVVNSPAASYEDKVKARTIQIKTDPNSKGMTDDDIAELISEELSFNTAGNATASTGNRPQRNNNPGNVKFGGLADDLAIGTDDQGHLVFPDAQTGFLAMQRDLQAKISGNSRFLPANPTIAQLGKVYAEDPNWSTAVARILGVSPSTKTNTIQLEQLAEAIATQEGFYA